MSVKLQRHLFLTAGLTLTIWYGMLLVDLARGRALPWLGHLLTDLLDVQNGALIVIAGALPIILFWGWASRVLSQLAMRQLAEDIKHKRKRGERHSKQFTAGPKTKT
jgi:hypothetical protein